MIADHVHELLPDDHYVRVSGVGHLTNFFLKLEGFNPAGSIKLKAARAMVAGAERSGDLRGRRLIESTSGNLGIALASICAAKGYSLTCVTDVNANHAAIVAMRALGAEVVIVDQRDGNGGFLASRLQYIQSLLSRDTRYLWLNQYANPANPESHQLLTGPALSAAFPRLDHLFVGVGTGGTLMGCLRWLRGHSPATRIVAVDAVGSVTFGGAPARRSIPGLGASSPGGLVDVHAPDDVVHVSEAATISECRWLARTAGLLAGGSTGTVLAAVRSTAHRLRSDATVVAISPDLGDRYLDTIYDDTWVDAQGLASNPLAEGTGRQHVAAL